MLTLTRKVGESIRIGDDIKIVVKEIRRNQVRIGIVAPREMPIYREEVWLQIQAECPCDDCNSVPCECDEMRELIDGNCPACGYVHRVGQTECV